MCVSWLCIKGPAEKIREKIEAQFSRMLQIILPQSFQPSEAKPRYATTPLTAALFREALDGSWSLRNMGSETLQVPTVMAPYSYK